MTDGDVEIKYCVQRALQVSKSYVRALQLANSLTHTPLHFTSLQSSSCRDGIDKRASRLIRYSVYMRVRKQGEGMCA